MSDYGTYAYDELKDRIIKIRKTDELDKNNMIMYTGSYKKALEYFGYSPDEYIDENKSRDLINIVIAHQLTNKFSTKTTEELYNILIKASETEKYYIQSKLRHKKVWNILNSLDDKKLNFDKEIVESLLSKKKLKDYQKRKLYKLKMFYIKYDEFIEFKTASFEV